MTRKWTSISFLMLVVGIAAGCGGTATTNDDCASNPSKCLCTSDGQCGSGKCANW